MLYFLAFLLFGTPSSVFSEQNSHTPSMQEIQERLSDVRFSREPQEPIKGSPFTLTWDSGKESATCTASGGWTGTKLSQGSEVIHQEEKSTSYTLSCDLNGDGKLDEKNDISISQFITLADYTAEDVGYERQQKGESLVASGKPLIFYVWSGLSCLGGCLGEKTTLYWYAVNADTCTADGSWQGPKPLIGREEVMIHSGLNSYLLTCERNGVKSNEARFLGLYGEGGSVGIFPEVTEKELPTAPKLNLVVSELRPKKGNEIAVFWDSANTDECVAYGGWEGEKPVSGQELVTVTKTTVFGMRCSTKDHLSSVQMYNAVGFDEYDSKDPRRPKVSFSMKSWDDALIDPGESATLVWQASNAVSCTGSGDWSGDLGISGTRIVHPGKTAVYEITCLSSDGLSSYAKDVMISVIEPTLSPYRGKFVRTNNKSDAWYIHPVSGKRRSVPNDKNGFTSLMNASYTLDNNMISRIPIGTLNVNGKDSDGDGLSDMLENALGLNSKSRDSDGDGHSDKQELQKGYNPLGKGVANFDDSFSCIESGKILRTKKYPYLWYVNPDNCMRYFIGTNSQLKNIIDGFDVPITRKVLDRIELAKQE